MSECVIHGHEQMIDCCAICLQQEADRQEARRPYGWTEDEERIVLETLEDALRRIGLIDPEYSAMQKLRRAVEGRR